MSAARSRRDRRGWKIIIDAQCFPEIGRPISARRQGPLSPTLEMAQRWSCRRPPGGKRAPLPFHVPGGTLGDKLMGIAPIQSARRPRAPRYAPPIGSRSEGCGSRRVPLNSRRHGVAFDHRVQRIGLRPAKYSVAPCLPWRHLLGEPRHCPPPARRAPALEIGQLPRK